MSKILATILLLCCTIAEAGPRERVAVARTLVRVRLEAVPDLPNDFERGAGEIPVPPPLSLLPPEQATTEPDDCFEAYLLPGCNPCDKFGGDWKKGEFRQYTVRSMGPWEGRIHPVFRWRVKGQWYTIEGYHGSRWLIDGIEKTKPKPIRKAVRGIVAWTYSVPQQLWSVGRDTKPELIEHLLQAHNTVGFTREQLQGMSRETLIQLHSAAHAGTIRRQ